MASGADSRSPRNLVSDWLRLAFDLFNSPACWSASALPALSFFASSFDLYLARIDKGISIDNSGGFVFSLIIRLELYVEYSPSASEFSPLRIHILRLEYYD